MPFSGLNFKDEDTFTDTLEDVVTSIKRNGIALKGESYVHCAHVTVQYTE